MNFIRRKRGTQALENVLKIDKFWCNHYIRERLQSLLLDILTSTSSNGNNMDSNNNNKKNKSINGSGGNTRTVKNCSHSSGDIYIEESKEESTTEEGSLEVTMGRADCSSSEAYQGVFRTR